MSECTDNKRTNMRAKTQVKVHTQRTSFIHVYTIRMIIPLWQTISQIKVKRE